MKIIFAAISLAANIALFIPYFAGMRKNQTKPHILTWLTWGILMALGFVLSFTSGGGAGSYTFAFESVLCFAVVAYAFLKKEKNIARFDWFVFGCVIVILFFYIFTKDALISAILAAAIDSLGYVPTFRKSYTRPYEEPPITYELAMVGWIFSVLALSVYSFITLIYPIAIITVNGSFITFLLIRRRTTKIGRIKI